MNITLMMAITADGKIAKDESHLADWTSVEDKKLFVEKTKEAGVIIMGRKTFETIGKPLPGRLNLVITSQAKEKQGQAIPGSLEFTDLSPKEIIEELKNKGFKNAILGGGAAINSLFLEQNLIDEIMLTVEPKIFGSGLNLFNNVKTDLNLRLLEIKKINENAVNLHYQVIK
ncbi:MAG TPA: dihydrofolate reductase family protein [Candidatus Bipolaricaulota bacterium]|nr:dihydrofolate reductase family protein [Candidatus Bipolaricaulota bacterium]